MRQTTVRRVLATACATILASCGGGGGRDAPVTPAPQPTLTLVAGTLDTGGTGSADGTGTAARFSATDLALGADGNFYVADGYNVTIRKVTPDGVVTTPWGRAGEAAHVDAVGTAARFQFPTRIAAAPDGSLYVMDMAREGGEARLRRIALDGSVTTVLEFPGEPNNHMPRFGAMVIDAAARLYIIDSHRCELRRVDLSKRVTETLETFPQGALCPTGPDVQIDRDGRLYFGHWDAANGRRQVMTRHPGTGLLSQAFEVPADMSSMAVRPDGVAFFQANAGVVYTVSPGGLPQRLSGRPQLETPVIAVDGDADSARFVSVGAMQADSANRVWMLDEGGSVLRRLDTDGRVTTLAGLGWQGGLFRAGTGGQARLGEEGNGAGVALTTDAAGNAYFSTGLRFRAIARVTPEGVATTLAGHIDERGTQDGAGAGARFEFIQAMTRDPSGSLLVADWREGVTCGRYNFATTRSVVRKVGADGTVSTLPYVFDGGISGLVALSGTTTLATGLRSVSHCNTEPKAAEVTAAGTETRVAAPPAGMLAGTLAGNGLGSSWYITGHAIGRRFADGRVVTVAGSETESGARDGPGAEARFNAPLGLDVDALGNVYVADTRNGTVRKITPEGTVSTLVGRANQHGIVLGPLPGGLYSPTAVAVVPQGLLIRSRMALLRVSF